MPQSSSNSVYLAIDLGASSGRVIAGVWDGQRLILDELNRFPTPSIKLGRYYHWDIVAVYRDILAGLRLAGNKYGDLIESVGVDTWGVDYGLLDSEGELLGIPICYRDGRLNGVMEEWMHNLSPEAIYAETGIQFMPFNTLYQLAAERRDDRAAFKSATRMLFIPDLLNYWLSGVMATERSIASTSQILNPVTEKWSDVLLSELGVTADFLGDIVETGTSLGPLSETTRQATGVGPLEVIAVAGHDTASAFVAIPSSAPNYAVLSSGTWSLMGLELDWPQLQAEALDAGFSNEIGIGKSVRFLKNISGMWLLEETRRQWQKEGREYSYEQIVDFAETSDPLVSLFDPDASEMAAPGDVPSRIRQACSLNGQRIPQTDAELVRSIFDSLAMRYRSVFTKLNSFAEEELAGIHILGGGSRNQLLNQMTADALGVSVLAGPAEATAIGNVLTQMLARGKFEDLSEARKIISKSFGLERYEPRDTESYARLDKTFEALSAS